MKTVLAFILCVLAMACSTGYQSKGIKGGYSDMDYGNGTYHVDYRVNNWTNPDMAWKYARRRASELTIQEGKPCYVITARSCGDSNQIGIMRIGSTTMIKPVGSTCSLDFQTVDSCAIEGSLKPVIQED